MNDSEKAENQLRTGKGQRLDRWRTNEGVYDEGRVESRRQSRRGC